MSEAKKILLIGAGGHCMSVLDSLLSSYHYDGIGIVNKNFYVPGTSELIPSKREIMGVPIVGTDDELGKLYKDGYSHAFITVGSIGDVAIRKQIYKLIKNIGYSIPNIIDNTAVVSPYTIMGEGIFVGKNAVINSNSKIGNCAIINTASVIEHESQIEDFVHLAPRSVLCGRVQVGSETHIGAGSVIKDGVQIGLKTIIGVGSIVVKNIGDQVVAYGNPCKEV